MIHGRTDEQKAFIGCIAHFVDVEFKPQALLLEFLRIKSQHTAEKIRNTTKDILEKSNAAGKIYRVITDNASNMIKAYKFELSIDDGDDQENEPENFSSEECSFNTDASEKSNLSVELSLTDPNSDMNDKSLAMNLNPRLSCFAHSLQLVIHDGSKNVPYLSKALNKCKELSRKSHKSLKVTDILDDFDKRLSQPNVTRWNS